jgi:hypothetical protein
LQILTVNPGGIGQVTASVSSNTGTSIAYSPVYPAQAPRLYIQPRPAGFHLSWADTPIDYVVEGNACGVGIACAGAWTQAGGTILARGRA